MKTVLIMVAVAGLSACGIETAGTAATAAADPELEPLGLRVWSCGLTHWPPRVLYPLLERLARKLAHSLKLALAMGMRPA